MVVITQQTNCAFTFRYQILAPVIIISCKHGRNTFIVNLNKNYQYCLIRKIVQVRKYQLLQLNCTISLTIFRVRLNKKTLPRQCGEYLSLTSSQKFLIGKHAADNEVATMVQYFSKAFPHNLPIFPRPFGITVLVICHFIPTIVSLHKYLPIFHPTNLSPYQYFATYCR